MPAPLESSGSSPLDWLDYRQYALALWARITRGFAQESARSTGQRPTDAPTADPLVVGVYGEWGVGKSRLLELVYELAAAQSAQDCAQRILDPDAYQSTQALRLTIPVWFHPWKYEHEEHLAVPLLMHVTDALRASLKGSNTFAERTAAQIESQGAALGKSAQEIAAAAKKGLVWGKRIAKVAHSVAGNELVKTATSVAAGFVGLAPIADRSLDWIAATSEKLVGDDESEDKKESKDKDGPAGSKKEPPVDVRPTHTADGRYYYNVQKYLRELAHITPETARKHGLRLNHEVHLNFVVFVDDLDRCLPEKAVQVLEVIKTLLNIECFAFVVALDDEVIERGISHRYRDYRFEHAKPEMPITGFEYLEKIVHLPFRLPQLTRAQAASFILQQENRISNPIVGLTNVPTAPRLWYAESTIEGGETSFRPTPLVALLLDSFEAYVPRKLTRTIELMNQFQQVLASRGIPMRIGTIESSAPIDSRMVLFNVLMQLFAPEVFRMIRRRPEMFGQWLRANLSEDTSKPSVFQWRKSTPEDPLVLEVSDADLYRWAALGSQAALPGAPGGTTSTRTSDSPADGTRSNWALFLNQPAHSQSDRHSIEQLRLPFAVAICEFRDTQRHAFSPLRLGAALAYAMGWTYASVPSLQSYMQLFGDSVASLVVTGATTELTATLKSVATVQATLGRPARAVNIREMLELIESPDAATRASLVERIGLLEGEVLDRAAVSALADVLPSARNEQLLQALASLGPYLDASLVKERSWTDLGSWKFAGISASETVARADEILDAAAPYAQLHPLGLSDELGLQATIESIRRGLTTLVSDDPAGLTIAQRVRAGDFLGRLGDPRFDPAHWHLPLARARVRDHGVDVLRDTTVDEERIVGFVRVPKGTFKMGQKGERLEPERSDTIEADFFMGRTLVTVDQFAQFLADGGYADDSWWDATGLAWRRGDFDSQATDSWFQAALLQRPPERRDRPWNWEAQRLSGNVPVSFINWFEARAYARWFDAQLRPEIARQLTVAYQVMLPTEKQWERAARAATLRTVDTRAYPWGNDSLDMVKRANVSGTDIGRPCSVALFEPTVLGLYDMVGNVSTWTDNLFLPIAGPTTRLRRDATFRPIKGEGEIERDDLVVIRGGGWNTQPEYLGCFKRRAVPPDAYSEDAGFRLVLATA